MSLKRIILKKTEQISYNQKEEFHRIKIHGITKKKKIHKLQSFLADKLKISKLLTFKTEIAAYTAMLFLVSAKEIIFISIPASDKCFKDEKGTGNQTNMHKKCLHLDLDTKQLQDIKTTTHNNNAFCPSDKTVTNS